jgi:hypothetical protein
MGVVERIRKTLSKCRAKVFDVVSDSHQVPISMNTVWDKSIGKENEWLFYKVVSIKPSEASRSSYSIDPQTTRIVLESCVNDFYPLYCEDFFGKGSVFHYSK